MKIVRFDHSLPATDGTEIAQGTETAPGGFTRPVYTFCLEPTKEQAEEIAKGGKLFVTLKGAAPAFDVSTKNPHEGEPKPKRPKKQPAANRKPQKTVKKTPAKRKRATKAKK